ncbi:MAG: cell division protein SepF [Clostridiales bacterium]|nr:cell division protein SepF [Clostridiales bacterium]
MGIYNKFLDFIGIEETDDLSEQEVYEEPARQRTYAQAPEPAPRPAKKREPRLSGGGETIPMPNIASMKMIVYHPVSYEDAQHIIDNLKSQKPVIINMEELEVNCAQRILDFLSGAVYAMNGSICKVSRGIFVVTPNTYDVIGNDEEYEEY